MFSISIAVFLLMSASIDSEWVLISPDFKSKMVNVGFDVYTPSSNVFELLG